MAVVYLVNRKDYGPCRLHPVRVSKELFFWGLYEMVFKIGQWKYLSKCWDLTPREVEVAKLVCEGLDNSRIGKKLRIAYNTVRAHLGNIFRKMGVQGKADMILAFVEVLRKARV